MSTFVFSASKFEKDKSGKDQPADDSPLFEIEVEADSNSNAIEIGTERFSIQHPNENLNNFIVGARAK